MRVVVYGLLVAALLTLSGCGGESRTDAGQTAVAGGASEPQAAPAIDGEKLYNRYCFSCHAAGIANAPKFADAEAWAPRLAKGRDLLLASVKNGIPPGMPAMGLCIGCSDEELAAVTDYMLEAAAPTQE